MRKGVIIIGVAILLIFTCFYSACATDAESEKLKTSPLFGFRTEKAIDGKIKKLNEPNYIEKEENLIAFLQNTISAESYEPGLKPKIFTVELICGLVGAIFLMPFIIAYKIGQMINSARNKPTCSDSEDTCAWRCTWQGCPTCEPLCPSFSGQSKVQEKMSNNQLFLNLFVKHPELQKQIIKINS